MNEKLCEDATGNVTEVGELLGDVRTEEIARMLSGKEITEEARAAAVSLLGSNKSLKASYEQ